MPPPPMLMTVPNVVTHGWCASTVGRVGGDATDGGGTIATDDGQPEPKPPQPSNPINDQPLCTFTTQDAPFPLLPSLHHHCTTSFPLILRAACVACGGVGGMVRQGASTVVREGGPDSRLFLLALLLSARAEDRERGREQESERSPPSRPPRTNQTKPNRPNDDLLCSQRAPFALHSHSAPMRMRDALNTSSTALQRTGAARADRVIKPVTQRTSTGPRWHTSIITRTHTPHRGASRMTRTFIRLHHGTGWRPSITRRGFIEIFLMCLLGLRKKFDPLRNFSRTRKQQAHTSTRAGSQSRH